MKPHVAEAERIQREIIRKMTPSQKFAIARGLYDTAWEIKRRLCANSILTGLKSKSWRGCAGFS